jgi:pimeloyl-ACP methyl ester carboxylesterase
MSSSSTHLPTPEGPGSVSGAPNLPSGFTDTFTSRYIDTAELRLHAVIGGEGPPLLLVHGWPQTWYQWRLVMPELARDFEVAADDVQTLVIDGSGHWVAEEAPEEMLAALTEFLAPYREDGGGLR